MHYSKKTIHLRPEQLLLIIKNHAEPLYDNVKEYLQHIKQPLSNSDAMLITEIYAQKVHELYPVIEKRVDESTVLELKAKITEGK